MSASHGWTVPGFSTVGELGSGATGRVVVAVQQTTGYRVAIKYLVPRLIGDETFVARFRTEARLLSMVRDPNVVQLFEYVETYGAAAIVMELVDGVALRKLIAEHGPTTPEAALCVLRGSLSGLGAAHRLGVVHRDYKPDNILVRPDGMSMLTDFGVAAAGGAAAGVAGTPAYMAPEQWRGSVGTPSDVYAASVVFFECLTGHPPFTGSTLQELAAAHAMARVPVEEVPEPLRGLLSYGMAKDPAQRPLTAELFAGELERVAGAAYGPDWAERGRLALGALVGITPVAVLLGAGLADSGGAGTGGAGGTTVGFTSFVSSTLGVTVLTVAGLAVIAGGVAVAVEAASASRPSHSASQAVRPPLLTETSSAAVSATPSSDSPTPSSDTTSASAPQQPQPSPSVSTTDTTPAAGPASLTLVPTSVAAGDSYTAEVSGFQPGETVTYSANPGNITGGTTTVDSSGNATNTIHVQPDVPPGNYTITATGQSSGLTASTQLTVAAPALHPSLSFSPNPVQTKTSYTVSFSGFQANEEVTLECNGTVWGTLSADGTGSATRDYTADVSAGSYDCTATGTSSGAKATAQLQVTQAAAM